MECSRLSSGRESNSDDSDSARVEEAPRLGAVQLGGGQFGPFGEVVNGIDKGG